MKIKLSRYTIFETRVPEGTRVPTIDLQKDDFFSDYVSHNLSQAREVVLEQIIQNVEHVLQEFGYETIGHKIELNGNTDIHGHIFFKSTDGVYCLQFQNAAWVELFDVTSIYEEPYNDNKLTYALMKNRDSLYIEMSIRRPQDIHKYIKKHIEDSKK